MRYALAFIFPPLAVLLCGKPFQALLVSPILTILGIIPGIVHACACVSACNRRKDLKALATIVGSRH
jgi:uncharacterized membrane protein YqaE (UPF0057 family)